MLASQMRVKINIYAKTRLEKLIRPSKTFDLEMRNHFLTVLRIFNDKKNNFQRKKGDLLNQNQNL